MAHRRPDRALYLERQPAGGFRYRRRYRLARKHDELGDVERVATASVEADKPKPTRTDVAEGSRCTRKGNLPGMPQAKRAIRPGSNRFYARSRISLIQQTFLAGLSGKIWRWLPIKALAHQRRSRAPHERRSNAVKQAPSEPFDHTKPGPPATSRTPSDAALILPAPWLYHPEPFLPGAAFPPTHSANPADLTRFPTMDR